MSRFTYKIPATKEIKDKFAKIPCKHPVESVSLAWGLDIDGYFLQIWTVEDGDDLYIEHGLMGTSNGRIFDKLNEYRIVNIMKNLAPKQFTALVLDLPMEKEDNG